MIARSPAQRVAETMRLLWRERLGHAQEVGRSGLTIDGVVDAALAIADSEGLDALTMRRVADALGVSAMTPYSYVPGKPELLELMVDATYAGMPVTQDRTAGWCDQVRAVAADNRALQRVHPWLLGVQTVRPPLGPGLLAKYDRELAAFDGVGLTDVEMDAALSHLLGFVRAVGLAEVEGATARAATDDLAWWEVAGPLLAELVDAAEFPRAARVGSAAGAAHGSAYDADTVFDFGLARFVDGLDALVQSRRP